MKLSKLLPAVGLITLFALLYVHQQTEIFRFAYLGQKKSSDFQELLDKNAALRYNIGKKVSLVRLGNQVSGNSDFQMPDAYRLVKINNPPETLVAKQDVPRENLFARVFGIKRQAEAKTISPSVSFGTGGN